MPVKRRVSLCISGFASAPNIFICIRILTRSDAFLLTAAAKSCCLNLRSVQTQLATVLTSATQQTGDPVLPTVLHRK